MKMTLVDVIGPELQNGTIYSGVSSIFVKFFGCNLRCPGFNINKYQYNGNDEVKDIITNLYSYSKKEKLPKTKTGCTQYYAMYPEFKRFTQEVTVEELVTIIKEKTSRSLLKKPHIIFTGGEPLLWQNHIAISIQELAKEGYTHFTIETNGTCILKNDFIRCILATNSYKHNDFKLLFSVSPKLKHSGHFFSETFVPEALRSYEKVTDHLYLNFIVKKEDSCKDEIMNFIKQYRDNDILITDIFITPTENNESDKEFAIALCNETGFRYSSSSY